MTKKYSKLVLFVFLLIFFILIILFSNFAPAVTNCWTYTSSSTCTALNGCNWRNDSWSSSGWCEELNCWSLYSQSGCTNTVVPGKNCTWQGGTTTYSCEKISCWSFSGASANSCVNNSLGLSCDWSNYCSSSGYNPNANCWLYQNQSSCLNSTGCSWGQCMEKGCWSYTTNTTCNSAKDSWSGNNCSWNSNNYCTQRSCSDYYQNESSCNAVTNLDSNSDQDCIWKWNYCQSMDCYNWDYTNATACINNTANLSCSWSGSYCNKKDCWNYASNATCALQPNCIWKGYVSSGWCNEVNCWTWDSWSGGNQTQCENNGAAYGLNCLWSIDPSNSSRGWCYKNMQSTSCLNITTERACMDTYYCWWQYNNWNNVSAGGNCNEPGSFGGTATNATILNDWNPGCYTFDMNSSDCNRVLGCNYTGSKCEIVSGHANANEINTNGLNCTMINNSQLCNSIPMLSACCAWQNNTCATNKLSTSCRDQMTSTPEGASFCEDYNSYTDKSLCEQIAGNPWYMPCKWDNATSKCGFKASDVFGNETQSLTKLDNKKNCESAGGKWISENYCEGNISVPSGRCEYKFDEEDNCNKACFACETKDSNGKSVNTTNARDACLGSELGICEFAQDTAAPNGIGYCKTKEQFKKGVAVNCDLECGDCTHKGNPQSNDTAKKPSYYCTTSKANSDGGGCKWINDNSTSTGGYCANKGEKTCEDSCDRCKAQTDCQNIGRTSVSNQSGSCKWQGEAATGSCVSNIGEDAEICWDGIDNTDDGLIDCADPSCYSDSYCGFVEGNCFGWTSNNTCISNNCEWLTDKFGSWCDFKGSQCWKYDSNSANCSGQSNCEWHNGTGNGWCERDWKISEACMGLNRTACPAGGSGCNWTVDSWCAGTGNGTEWCRNNGGWCDHVDFAPKNCWTQTTTSGCNSTNGCSWKADQYSTPHCEVNWSGNCWQYSAQNSCNVTSCRWKNDSWGGWCENSVNICYERTTQSTCGAVSGNICSWNTNMWGGYCEPGCYTANSSSCSSISSCIWKGESGWCEESAMASCSNNTNMNNQPNCQSTQGCRWKQSGWCDPKGGGFSAASTSAGGGVGTAIGADCYKYDGNQTLCTNKSIINISCGWMPAQQSKCEVNWGKNCWQYTSVTGCNSTNGCWFKNDSWGSSCMNILDQCWNNISLQGISNQNCSANPYCINNSWGGCEPRCFSANITNCAAGNLSGNCKWVSGWCNPAGMNQMFTGMESGILPELGKDGCGTENITQASVDICGFGIRDMADSYGFGANVYDFSNSSICNKEELSSYVMSSVSGGGGGGMHIGQAGSGMSAKLGSGNDTIQFFVYLDTDGSTTGGCAVSHNSSAVGYEFRLKYVSTWNANQSKAVETFNAYKCDDGDWKVTDIKLSAWKKKMCSEIGGPMIAIKKADLEKYPTLYDSTKDIGIFVATIGNTGNISSPADIAGPSWTTPGSMDFEIISAFDYGVNKAKSEDILKKGYVQYEDCFNNIDDNSDNATDCNDWGCQFSSNCAGRGVNAANYTDTSSPLVSGVKIEEYPDSALVMYDTNKPTNGTLNFYGNDSQCLSLNATIYDVGILKNNTVRMYKLWHAAKIYNATNSLPYNLQNGTAYYYKLKVCDLVGRCAISKCSSFTTASSPQKCGYCNFVARIKTPSNWNVYYDVNKDGNYEHWQGHVCGPNAGMKINYSIARSVNIKLNTTDGTGSIEFFNVSLTKTSLNDKVRTISSSGSIIVNATATDSSGNDIGYVGMISETRDKIINNLYPEVCQVIIPRGDTNCAELWHCSDTGQNCTNKTSSSTFVNSTSTTCTWKASFCEFSVWASGQPGTYSAPGTTTTSSGGGGGGGGGGGANKTKAVATLTPESEIPEGEEGAKPGEGAGAKEGGIGKILKKTNIGLLLVISVLVVIVVIVFFVIKRKRY